MKVFLPGTLEDLWERWEKIPNARIYAGGTDFMVKLREGAIQAPALICLERIPALTKIREEENTLFIGAGVSHAGILTHPLVQTWCPVLVEALRVLGSPLIRNMGTLGGNIATASPAGDSLPALYVLDAEVVLADARKTRVLPISDFILSPGKTSLKEREIIRGVRIPRPMPYTMSRYEKVGKRKAMAVAVASLAACLRFDTNGVVKIARLAWGSVGPTIVTASRVEKALVGFPLSRKHLEEIAPMVEEAVSPIDDIRASAVYRKKIAINLLCRLAGDSNFNGRFTP